MLMPDKQFVSHIRLAILAFIFFTAYTVIAIRMWFVQVQKVETTRERVSKQYVRNIRVPALRGRIISADGVILAENHASYDLVFHLSEMRQPGRISNTVKHIFKEIERVSKVINRKNPYTQKQILSKIYRSPGLPFTIFANLNPQELAEAYEFMPFVPGMEIAESPIRKYPNGQLAAHVIGYVRRDDPANADDRTNYNYYIPDTIGAAGLEYACDLWKTQKKKPDEIITEDASIVLPETPQNLLRGTPGKQMIIVDHLRFIRKIIEPSIPAENGKDIVLTLDAKAQKIAERLIRGFQAAVVVLDASDGKVLVMASAPAFNPSEFVPKITRKRYQELLNHPGKPFMNKALQGTFSPGSIMKPLIGLTFLANGGDVENTIECDGATWFGEHPLNCWIRPLTGGGHGPVDLREAITISCNDYFIETGMNLGIDKLTPAFQSAGFGRKTGFILPESAGRAPDKRHKQKWTSFDTALCSIGQGDILITPLQAAVYASALANGGTLWKPRILDRVLDVNGNEIFKWNSEKNGKLIGTREQIAIIQDAMHNSVHAANGGSKNANTEVIDLFGKTGTAEVGVKPNHYKNTWFIGFGTDPKSGRLLAIAVMVSHGASGGKTAAPIARQFFEAYL